MRLSPSVNGGQHHAIQNRLHCVWGWLWLLQVLNDEKDAEMQIF
jgi:hypothetical protein